ncbi:MAG: hypothetical protein IJ253_09510 [Bacteroidaceae bacterium]|nr:hypothetical protein [Bacteroidaceae bacterium]
MELSILQYNKDNNPQRVQLEDMARQMGEGTWPEGYSPLLVVPAVVEDGRQKKNIRWLTGLAVAHFEHISQEEMADIRAKAADDLHTMLCVRDAIRDGIYIVYPFELHDHFATDSKMRFYAKAFTWGADYYAHLLGRVADRTCSSLTQAIPLCRDPEVYCNLSAIEFSSDEILQKRSDGQGEDRSSRHAAPKDIEAFLKDRIALRRNLVTGRVECSPDWQPITNDKLNSLWADMKDEHNVKYEDVFRVIRSERFPDFHPFRSYLESLPPWDGGNHILAHSLSVSVKGGTDEQMFFYECLRKWLVGMVAGWLDAREVNNSILVLIGEQGIQKTTWFQFLLPPCLESYIFLKTNGGQFDKDDKLRLTSYGLVCLEELDAMDDVTMNKLKSIMTARTIDERPPYERFSEHRKHLASFCGTGNNRIFINDRTGTRRWLPFEVESILSPRKFPFDYEGIYSEAYALYKEGFRYWFSPQEEALLKAHNKCFEVPHPEEELVSFYFRLPDEMQAPAFYPTSIVLDIITRNTRMKNVSCVSLGRVLAVMGYEAAVVKRHHGYYLERRKSEEVNALPHTLAYEGLHGIRRTGTDDTDGF